MSDYCNICDAAPVTVKHYTRCLPCHRVKQREQAKRSYLKNKYRLTLEDRDKMYLAQGGLCAICHTTPTGERALFIDHDHNSGMIRGLLCTLCNSLLGMAKDSPYILEQAQAYIVAHTVYESDKNDKTSV